MGDGVIDTNGLIMYSSTVFVEEGSTKYFYFPLAYKGIIKGIKVLGNYDTGDFYFNVYSRPPEDDGEYVYASGKVTTVLWDIMDIPFIDETGHNQVYCSLQNQGADTEFTIKIYLILKG